MCFAFSLLNPIDNFFVPYRNLSLRSPNLAPQNSPTKFEQIDDDYHEAACQPRMTTVEIKSRTMHI